MNPAIFKAYDVRGVYPSDLDASAVQMIGRALIDFLGAGKAIVLGKDVRESGPVLFDAFARGVIEGGGTVVDIGTVTTEMMYFAVAHGGYDGGVMVSASHNERQFNGLKFVREGARAISMDTGLAAIRDRAMEMVSPPFSRGSERGLSATEITPPHLPLKRGGVMPLDIWDAYIDKLLSCVDVKNVKPFRIVANANFGMAGRVFERLIARGKLPIEIIPMDFEPDGTFPKGKPDPMIPERREEIIARVKKEKPDFGVAWDADADRVFFFDERGGFIHGYYTISLLARHLLAAHPGEKVLYDIRQVWASHATVTASGGIPIAMKPGHSFIKDRMRQEDALFAGENSGHFYFRDFYGVDSGMIPFLLMLSILSKEQRSLSALADAFRGAYPISEEINSTVNDTTATIARIREHYSTGVIETIDGLSVAFDDWRFNLRASNTEPVIRLNVEAKTPELVEKHVAALLALIRS